MMWRVVGVVLLVMAYQSSAEDWATRLKTSVSLRNPAQLSRDVDGVTVRNPFDWQLASGIETRISKLSVEAEWQWERQNGFHYFDQEYDAGWKSDRLGAGLHVTDSEEAQMYLVSAHVEVRRGPLGLGYTRHYTTRWLGEAASLARLSFDWQPKFSPKIGKWQIPVVQGVIKAAIEWRPDQNREVVHIELRVGGQRVQFVPFVKINRVERDGKPTQSKWQMKWMVSVGV